MDARHVLRKHGRDASVVMLVKKMERWFTEAYRPMDCAMECYCYLRNVHDKTADGKTASENMFGVQFDGALIPTSPSLRKTRQGCINLVNRCFR